MPLITFILQEPHSLGQCGARVTLTGHNGESLLHIALDGGIAVEHTCGGVCGCSTCHVWVRQGADRLSPPSDAEMDRIDQAPDARTYSRLACQARLVTDEGELIVEVPAWNRNIVKETPHGH